MATQVKLTGVKELVKKNKKKQKEHRIAIQKGLAVALTKTRQRAEEHLITNVSGTLNPHRARAMQPTLPGRLTSRTGKLGYMLGYGINVGNPLSSWDNSSFGKINAKEVKNIGLKGQIKSVNDRSYSATYRVSIKPNGVLMRTNAGPKGMMPQESVKSLAIRFNWETGIRGQKRAIFSPVVDLTEFDMRTEIIRRNSEIWSK